MLGMELMELDAETFIWLTKFLPVVLFLLLWSAFEIIAITDLKSDGGLKQFRRYLETHPLNTRGK